MRKVRGECGRTAKYNQRHKQGSRKVAPEAEKPMNQHLQDSYAAMEKSNGRELSPGWSQLRVSNGVGVLAAALPSWCQ